MTSQEIECVAKIHSANSTSNKDLHDHLLIQPRAKKKNKKQKRELLTEAVEDLIDHDHDLSTDEPLIIIEESINKNSDKHELDLLR